MREPAASARAARSRHSSVNTSSRHESRLLGFLDGLHDRDERLQSRTSSDSGPCRFLWAHGTTTPLHGRGKGMTCRNHGRGASRVCPPRNPAHRETHRTGPLPGKKKAPSHPETGGPRGLQMVGATGFEPATTCTPIAPLGHSQRFKAFRPVPPIWQKTAERQPRGGPRDSVEWIGVSAQVVT
jgi:hypothetical protein